MKWFDLANILLVSSGLGEHLTGIKLKDVEPNLTSGDDVEMKVTGILSLAIAALLSISLTQSLTAAEISAGSPESNPAKNPSSSTSNSPESDPANSPASSLSSSPASSPEGGSNLATSERLMLKVGSETVFSLYRHVRSGRYDGGVILLHDQGTHPDWPGVIQTLRRELPLYGWSTLSIELPVITANISPEESIKVWRANVSARMDAALVEMEKRNIFNVVVIGHGGGAFVAADYLSNKQGDQGEQIQGLIAISMDGSRVDNESLDGAMLLRRVNKPILDIYGSRDLDSVMSSATRRETIAITAAPGQDAHHLRAAEVAINFDQQIAKEITYRQHRIEGADHQFRGYEQQLLKRVVGWLRRYADGARIKINRKEQLSR